MKAARCFTSSASVNVRHAVCEKREYPLFASGEALNRSARYGNEQFMSGRRGRFIWLMVSALSKHKECEHTHATHSLTIGRFGGTTRQRRKRRRETNHS